MTTYCQCSLCKKIRRKTWDMEKELKKEEGDKNVQDAEEKSSLVETIATLVQSVENDLHSVIIALENLKKLSIEPRQPRKESKM